MKKTQKGSVSSLLIVIIILLVVIIIGGVYFISQGNHEYSAGNLTPSPIATASPTPSPSQTAAMSVPGMSKYTDPEFGFSFWYPNSWNVSQVTVQNSNKYPGGNVLKELSVSNGVHSITLDEYVSPGSTITDSTGVGPCPVCVPTRFYFNFNQHTWMVEYPQGTPSGKSGSAVPAIISQNTMGGLHMFYGSMRFGANVIVPLSANDFVVVSVDGAIATGSGDSQALTKTIVALDPTVATPASEAEQVQAIKAEMTAYGGM